MAGSKPKAGKIFSAQTNGGKGKRGGKEAGGEESIKKGSALLQRRMPPSMQKGGSRIRKWPFCSPGVTVARPGPSTEAQTIW